MTVSCCASVTSVCIVAAWSVGGDAFSLSFCLPVLQDFGTLGGFPATLTGGIHAS